MCGVQRMPRTNEEGCTRRIRCGLEKVAEAFIKEDLLLGSLALINADYYDSFISSGPPAVLCDICLSLLLSPQRPLAISVVGQMKDPTFATFMYLLSCGKQSSFFCSQGQEYTVVFWDGKEETR